MAILTLSCPHCRAPKMTFTVVAGYDIPGEEADVIHHLLCRCNQCQESVLVWLLESLQNYEVESQDPVSLEGNLLRIPGFQHLRTFPIGFASIGPEHLPDPVSQRLTESVNNLGIGSWESAGMMLRKALQLATREIAERDKDIDATRFMKSNLYERIDILADRTLITPDMKEWAHAIRLEGNEAAHEEDEEFTEDQAVQMKEFTELLLIYAFTLPARMEKARQGNRPV